MKPIKLGSIIITTVLCSSSCDVEKSELPNYGIDDNLPEQGEDDNTPNSGINGKYNVLLIMADDFNYWANCIGYYPGVKTPNIDKLAESGTLFSNAFSASPVSNPSRNALWSGIRPATSGIDNNSSGYIRTTKGFENIVTMNQFFMQKGYHVYGGGKLYHPGTMTGSTIDKHNWSQLNTHATGGGGYGAKIASWTNPGWETLKYNIGSDPFSEKTVNDHALACEVADFIKNYSKSNNKDKNFFIGCGFFRPHLPWNTQEEFWNEYASNELAPPPGYFDDDLNDINQSASGAHSPAVNQNKWGEQIRAYLSCLTMTDRSVGTLLEALDNSEYKENTIVVFMGDHGWQLGEKKQWGKNTIYNPANKTTLIIRHPEYGGQLMCTTPVSLQDIYPTLMSMCGYGSSAFVQGNDISPLVQNPKTTWDKPVLCTYSGTHYIQDAKYKYTERSGNMQFYDIANDPYEHYNLYNKSEYKNEIAIYKGKLQGMLNECNDLRSKLGLGARPTSKVATRSIKQSNIPFNISAKLKIEHYIRRSTLIEIKPNTLTLDLLSTESLTNLSIYNRSGDMIESRHIVGEGELLYNISNSLAKGKYYLVLEDGAGTSVESFEL